MHRVVSYVFGWIFAIVLTLMMWAIFINSQEYLYGVMEPTLSAEWNRNTGDNGTFVNSYKDEVWSNDTNQVFKAYQEEG